MRWLRFVPILGRLGARIYRIPHFIWRSDSKIRVWNLNNINRTWEIESKNRTWTLPSRK